MNINDGWFYLGVNIQTPVGDFDGDLAHMYQAFIITINDSIW